MYILWVLVFLSSICSITLTCWFSQIFFSESRKGFSWSNCNSWVFVSPTVGYFLPTQQDDVQSSLSKQCSEGECFPQQGRGSVPEWKSPSLNFPLTSPFLWVPVFGHLRQSLHGRSAENCKSCFCFEEATAPQLHFLAQDAVCFEGLCLLLRNRYGRAQGTVKSGNLLQECSASKPALKEVCGKLLFPWLEKE